MREEMAQQDQTISFSVMARELGLRETTICLWAPFQATPILVRTPSEECEEAECALTRYGEVYRIYRNVFRLSGHGATFLTQDRFQEAFARRFMRKTSWRKSKPTSIHASDERANSALVRQVGDCGR